jgi:rhodanese-related sulfurtransferase
MPAWYAKHCGVVSPASFKEAFLDKDIPAVILDVRPAAEGGEAARAAALEVVKAGYPGVNILAGGIKGWQAAALPVETGAPATQVAYVPKLRPGSVAVAEFTRLASLAPEARKDVVILDVRSREEAKAGMIKGALNAPQDELDAHLAEIPRDKRISFTAAPGPAPRWPTTS